MLIAVSPPFWHPESSVPQEFVNSLGKTLIVQFQSRMLRTQPVHHSSTEETVHTVDTLPGFLKRTSADAERSL